GNQPSGRGDDRGDERAPRATSCLEERGGSARGCAFSGQHGSEQVARRGAQRLRPECACCVARVRRHEPGAAGAGGDMDRSQGSYFAASNENSSPLPSLADYKRKFSSWRSFMNRFLFTPTLLLALSLVALQAAAQKNPVDAEGHQWWQHAVFYEVYPRSFADG